MEKLNRYEKKIKTLLAEREPIVEQCEGCEKIEVTLCKAAISPKAKWRGGICNLATHVAFESEEEKKEKIRLGQQKSKKKSRRKR